MILEKMFERRSATTRVPFEEWRSTGALLAAASGVRVTPQTALKFAAVYGAVRILAESVAMIPLPLYERLPDGGKRRAIEHPLYQILHDLANPEMTAYECRETLQGHLVTWGTAYAEIEWGRNGYPKAMWPLPPNLVTVYRDRKYELCYKVAVPRQDPVVLRAPYIMKLRGLSFDGIVGYKPSELGKEPIATGLAAEEYGARFFSNNATPSGVLEHPGILSDAAFKRLRKGWNKRHKGLSNAQRTAILEEGLKFHEIGIPPERAQFLETRKFQVSEIARMFRIPPHMLADLDRATFSNIEQMSQEFLTYSLNPWLVNWEQVIFRDLLLPSERGRYFAEFLRSAVVTADIQSRYQAYATGRQNGWLSANDIRAMENMNQVEGGDVYLVPLNMIPANMVGQLGATSAESSPSEPDQEERRQEQRDFQQKIERRAHGAAVERQRLMTAYLPIYEDTYGRMLRMEANDVGNAARKYFQRRSAAEFDVWLSDFYKKHHAFLQKHFRAALESYADLVRQAVASELGKEPPALTQFLAAYLEGQASRHVNRHEKRLRRLLAENSGDPLPAIEDELTRWREIEPGLRAREEATRANNAIAVAAYAALQILYLRWMTMGDSCPYCSKLEGRTIGIKEHFLQAGTEFQPEGAERPLKITRNIGHPPAHAGCDCMVVAG